MGKTFWVDKWASVPYLIAQSKDYKNAAIVSFQTQPTHAVFREWNILSTPHAIFGITTYI